MVDAEERAGGIGLALLGLIGAGACCFDDWRDPTAWRAKHCLGLPRRVAPFPDLGIDCDCNQLLLSRDGRWVGVVDWGVDLQKGSELSPATWIYRVDEPYRHLRIDQLDSDAAYKITFSADEDLLAFSSDGDPDHILIAGLADGKLIRRLTIPPAERFFSEMVWLPGNRIALTRIFGGTATPGPDEQGSLRIISADSGKTLRHVEGDESISLDVRLRHEYRRDWTTVSVHESESGDLLARVPSGHPERASDWGPRQLPTFPFQASPNLAFAVTDSESYGVSAVLLDLKSASPRDPDQISLHQTPAAFTRSGQLLTYTGISLVDWKWPPQRLWLTDVPLVRRFYDLLDYDRVQVIDPASGKELAHTSATRGRIQRLALSHDGSTLAVLTERRVYIYDVPAEFR